MKVFFLFPYPTGESPSQRFRFEQYFEILCSAGFEIKTQSFWDLKAWRILYKPNHASQKMKGFLMGILRRIKVLFSVSQSDFVFIHRECAPLGPPVFEWILAKILRKKIIYDFDDSIWLQDSIPKKWVERILKWPGKVSNVCEWSHRISSGNAYLSQYATRYNPQVIVNPTTIDTEYLHNPKLYNSQKKNNWVTIGWTGTHSTMPYLHSLLPVFKIFWEKFPDQWRLLIIADQDPNLNLPFVIFKRWSKVTEIEDLLQMDIGVMPLPEDLWTKGKCGFKALQYLSLEIPALVSPVGVNNEIVQHGISGYQCGDEKAWLDNMELLMLDPIRRKDMGRLGRQEVISRYSVLSNSSTFLGLFS